MKIARAAHLKKNHKIIRPSILPMKIISQGKLRSATREACEYAQTWSRPHKEKPHILPSLTRKTLRAMTPMVSVPPPPKRAPFSYSLYMDCAVKFAPTGKFKTNKKGELKEKLMVFKLGTITLVAADPGVFGPSAPVEEIRIVKRTSDLKLKTMRARFARLCGEAQAVAFDSFVKELRD
jgi:hypothetical protein